VADPRYVTVCPGALYTALRQSGRPSPHRVVSVARAEAEYQQRQSDHRAAVALLLDHGALKEPFLTAAVRVSVARGPGMRADIDWPAAGELLREPAEPVASSDTATVWWEAFTIATQRWSWVPLCASNPPAAAAPASTQPAGSADDGEYVKVASDAWVTRAAIHDALRRWAQRLVDAPIYALEAERFARMNLDQQDAIEQLIEADAIRDEFMSRAVIVSIASGAVDAYVSWYTARSLLTGMPPGPVMRAWRDACRMTARLT